MAAADLISILQQTGGIAAIANQLGIPPQMAEAGAGALLPAIVGGMSKQADAAGGGAGGLGSLIGILGSLGGAGLANNVLSDEPTNVDAGNSVLGTIFGSKDVSRTVADHASGQTGIDPAILKKMLPILAMLVAGYFSHQAGGGQQQEGQGGILGSVLGSVLGGGQGGAGGILGSVLGSVLGGGQASAAPAGGGLGGLGSLLDLNHDGNPLDDILGMAGKLVR
ncbi:DUF937 domain-containing protein [Novosphingobium sp.]|uniref:DUF937 domain-containing protein n=1 Tax=Novosphingobium sp. TaxID=1874826 RepID=UPI00286A98C5|nr:DUF937 domain-containing protein [Novosphingobium sp.]